MSASDPAGQFRVDVRDPELRRYRFALGITDFLLCGACGVYVAAIMRTGSGLLGVLNLNVLDEREPFAREAEPMRYGAETVADREARRGSAWMPVEVRTGALGARPQE